MCAISYLECLLNLLAQILFEFYYMIIRNSSPEKKMQLSTSVKEATQKTTDAVSESRKIEDATFYLNKRSNAEEDDRVQELCESRGGRPGLPSLISLRFLRT